MKEGGREGVKEGGMGKGVKWKLDGRMEGR